MAFRTDAMLGLLSFTETLGFLYCVQTYGIQLISVKGSSMEPTLAPKGNWVLFSRYPTTLQRGSVVVSVSPEDPNCLVVKRIVGLPHDTLEARRGRRGPLERITVPKGHVWLEGDNASASHDSRSYGPVPLGLVQGAVLCKVGSPAWFLIV